MSFQRIDDLHVNFDVTWMNWSGYISPTAKLKALLEVEPPEGIPVELPDSPAPARIVPPAFEDRFVPRVGVEHIAGSFGNSRGVHGEDRALVQLPVCLGCAYEPSPVPDQVGVNNLIDADRHTLTVGTGVTLNGPIEELPGAIHLDFHGDRPGGALRLRRPSVSGWGAGVRLDRLARSDRALGDALPRVHPAVRHREGGLHRGPRLSGGRHRGSPGGHHAARAGPALVW